MLQKNILAVVLLVVAGPVFAQAESVEAEGPWSGNASLGFLSTSGNTETTSYNTTLGISFARNAWKHAISASAIGADESDVTTAESYQAGWQTDYNFTDFDFIFATIDWRKDRFSGVDRQITESLGYGRRLIDTPKHVLSTGIGIGRRSATLADETKEIGVIGRGNVDYSWLFTEASSFDQNFIVEAGSDNTYFESISAVRAKLFGDFGLVLSYTIKQNSSVPVGSEKTDRLSTVSIEYIF